MIYLIFISAISIMYFQLPPHWAILMGIAFSLFFPAAEIIKKNSKAWSSKLLQFSIVLLGAGLNFQTVLKTGANGIVVTAVSISSVFVIAVLLNRLFKIDNTLSHLITAGTSICGGSAISAISPVIGAPPLTMATALGIVFILNAIAVFIFPPVGNLLLLTQEQFGTWAALAIHDTSSVVAASQIYGSKALEIGTTLKLTRALWIIPLSLIFASLKKTDQKMSIPWFIILFLLVSLLFTFIPELQKLTPYFSITSKVGLSLTLFLIGLSLNKDQIKTIGLRPVLFGISLWIITALGSLFFVLI